MCVCKQYSNQTSTIITDTFLTALLLNSYVLLPQWYGLTNKEVMPLGYKVTFRKNLLKNVDMDVSRDSKLPI